MDLITAALALGTEVFKFINEKEAKKYLDARVKIEKELKAEYDKGFECDDAKIESLHQEAKIIVEAARDALMLRVTAK